MPSDVNLNIGIEKKGEGDKQAAAGLELVAKSADNAKDQLAQLDRKLLETRAVMVAAGKTFTETGNISPFKAALKDVNQVSQVRKALQGVSADTKQSKVEVVDLGKELEATRGKLKDLGEEYKRTGSVEINHYHALTGELRKLEQAKRDLDKLTSQTSADPWGLNKASGFSLPALGPLSANMTTALAAGALAAGPAISAAVSGAVLVAVGGGVLALGIKSAVADPQVKAAWTTLGDDVKASLRDASSSLDLPLIQAADRFRKVFDSEIAPALARDFEVLAPAIDHLSAGMEAFAHNVLPGFNSAVQASAPLLSQMGDDLGRMGSAIGFFFQRIADSGPGAQAFFTDLTTAIDFSVGALGGLLEAGSKLYQFWHDTPILGSGVILWLDKLDGGNKKAKDSTHQLADSFGHYAAGTDEAIQAALKLVTAQDKLNASMQTSKGRADALKQQLDALYGGQIGAADATDTYNSALVTLEDTVGKNTTATGLSRAAIDSHKAAINQAEVSIKANEAAIAANKGSVDAHRAAIQSAQASIESHQLALSKGTGVVNENALSLAQNTRTGLDNRKMLEDVAKASVALTVADVNNGMTLEEATKKHQDRIDKLRAEAVQLGFTKADTDALITTYGEVPKDVTTNVRLTGAEAVKQQLIDLKVAQLSLAQNIDISQANKEVRNQLGQGGGGLAAGGRIPGPPSAVDNLIARTPWGLLGLATGEFVVNAHDTQRALPMLQWINSGMPGLAGGGIWPNYWPFPVDASKTKIPKTLQQIQQDAISKALTTGSGGNWSAVAQAVATALHQPGSWPSIVRRIMFESGGSPTIVNTTDSNWFAGHPSVGLAQVIAGTYRAYVNGYDTGPYEYGVSTNPFANVYAGMAYATSRYGSIAAVDPLNMPSGYARGGLIPTQSFDTGGLLGPGYTLAYNGTGRYEHVSPFGARSAGPTINITVNAGVGDPNAIAHEVGRYVQKFVLAKGGDVKVLGRRGSS